MTRVGCTYFARALNEWLKDFAAKWRRVCRKTSTFSGLKLSPSSEDRVTEGLSDTVVVHHRKH